MCEELCWNKVPTVKKNTSWVSRVEERRWKAEKQIDAVKELNRRPIEDNGGMGTNIDEKGRVSSW